MVKLNKGPSSLGILLDTELKAEKPAWETIQPQTKEYAQLAGDMVKHDPARGSKESWAKLAAAYAESATELDKAAQAKDKDAARDAHTELSNSCMACHRQHRGGGPGMGGGMRRPGGGPPGGPQGGGQRKFGPPPGGGPCSRTRGRTSSSTRRNSQVISREGTPEERVPRFVDLVSRRQALPPMRIVSRRETPASAPTTPILASHAGLAQAAGR